MPLFDDDEQAPESGAESSSPTTTPAATSQTDDEVAASELDSLAALAQSWSWRTVLEETDAERGGRGTVSPDIARRQLKFAALAAFYKQDRFGRDRCRAIVDRIEQNSSSGPLEHMLIALLRADLNLRDNPHNGAGWSDHIDEALDAAKALALRTGEKDEAYWPFGERLHSYREELFEAERNGGYSLAPFLETSPFLQSEALRLFLEIPVGWAPDAFFLPPVVAPRPGPAPRPASPVGSRAAIVFFRVPPVFAVAGAALVVAAVCIAASALVDAHTVIACEHSHREGKEVGTCTVTSGGYLNTRTDTIAIADIENAMPMFEPNLEDGVRVYIRTSKELFRIEDHGLDGAAREGLAQRLLTFLMDKPPHDPFHFAVDHRARWLTMGVTAGVVAGGLVIAIAFVMRRRRAR